MAQKRFFPDPRQLLLLKFCLRANADEARQAWQAWRVKVDLDDLDQASFRIMSLAYRRLVDLGIDDPDLRRIKGLHRYHWTRNQLAWRGKDEVLRALQEEGIPTVLLKGAALSRTVYPEPATRGMHDLDILVPIADAAAAMAVLTKRSWAAQHFDVVATIDHLHAATFVHPEFGELDLHWHVLRSCCQTERDTEMWAAARDFPVDGLATKILCPADQLLHACEHGLHPSPASTLQWLVDATFIVRNSPAPFDWERLAVQAQKVRLVLAARRTLSFIREHFEPSLPREILAALDAIPVTALERVEYFLAGQSEEDHEKLPQRVGVALCHFLKLRERPSGRGFFWEFLVYFRLLNHERRPWPVVACDEALRFWRQGWDDLGELGFRLGRFLRRQSRPIGGPISRARHLQAFYKVENKYTSSFRWSEPEAALHLDLPPGAWFLRLQLHPFRDLARLWDDEMIIDFNGHPLIAAAFRTSGQGRFLICRLDPAWRRPEGLQTLAWTIRPWPTAFDTDMRKLGLPLARLWIYRDETEPCES